MAFFWWKLLTVLLFVSTSLLHLFCGPHFGAKPLWLETGKEGSHKDCYTQRHYKVVSKHRVHNKVLICAWCRTGNTQWWWRLISLLTWNSVRTSVCVSEGTRVECTCEYEQENFTLGEESEREIISSSWYSCSRLLAEVIPSAPAYHFLVLPCQSASSLTCMSLGLPSHLPPC